MSSRINIEKQSGRLTAQTKDELIEQIRALEDGPWTVDITPGKRGYTPSRYKFYFSCVLWQILTTAGRFYRIVNPQTGEEREPRNTQELHECMKAIYNPVVLNVGGKSRVIAGTTTDLTDSEFIGQYLEQIVSDHAGPPYLVEFIDYEHWKELCKTGQWPDFKKKTESGVTCAP